MDVWTQRGTGREGRIGRAVLIYIHYHVWNRQLVGSFCVNTRNSAQGFDDLKQWERRKEAPEERDVFIPRGYMYVLSRFSRVWLFATPGTAACQAPLSMWFPRQEYWSALPFPLPGDLPHAGIEPVSLRSPALTGGFFTTSATGEALVCVYSQLIHLAVQQKLMNTATQSWFNNNKKSIEDGFVNAMISEKETKRAVGVRRDRTEAKTKQTRKKTRRQESTLA